MAINLLNIDINEIENLTGGDIYAEKFKLKNNLIDFKIIINEYNLYFILKINNKIELNNNLYLIHNEFQIENEFSNELNNKTYNKIYNYLRNEKINELNNIINKIDNIIIKKINE